MPSATQLGRSKVPHQKYLGASDLTFELIGPEGEPQRCTFRYGPYVGRQLVLARTQHHNGRSLFVLFLHHYPPTPGSKFLLRTHCTPVV
jgi:hypothetical protein